MFLKKSNRLALVDINGDRITHTQLVNNIKYYSKYFIDIKKEKSFNLIIMENSVKWLYTFYAIWDKKSTVVAIDAMSNVEEILYFLNDCHPENIVVSNKTYDAVKEAVDKSGLEINILNSSNFEIDLEKLKEFDNDNRDLSHPDMEDIAVMLYTSGTTGAPKGVMLTYSNIVNEIDTIKILNVTYDDEQVLGVLPYHHILPLMSTNLYFLYHKNQYSIVLIEKLTSQEILKALEKNDVTVLSLVPRVYKLFYKSIKDTIDSKWITKMIFNIAKKLNNKKFSKIIFKKVHEKFGGKLRTLISGGAKADIEMIDFFTALGFDYCEGYGLTETSPVLCGSTPNHGWKAGTVGKVTKNIESKIVDGELWVRGPVVMKGYYNKPEKTKEVLTEDGWFKTGDLVEVDEDGMITIIGRKNSMIVLSNGKNIDPETLEIKFSKIPNKGIKDIGIFGYNDKLCALIVIDKNEMKKNNISNINAHIKDVVEFYNGSVHNYEKILEYKITEEELPKTRIGKTRRFMLKDMYLGEMEVTKKEKVKEPDTKEYKVLKEYILSMKGSVPEPDKNLEIEFGFDSLDQVELLTFIENSFGIKMNEESFKENMSLLGISEYIINNSKGYTESKDQWKEIIDKAPKKELKEGYLNIFLKPIIYILFKIYFRISIKGSENISDKQQIFIANHESFIDSLALGLLLPSNVMKKTYSLAIDWYFKNIFMKFVANNGNIILLDIDNNIKQTIENVATALKQGKNVFIFPEGTRTKDGNLGEFKKSFAILAKELNIPITCLKINGAYEAYSRYVKFPRPKHISVEYLGEVNPKDLSYNEIVEKSREMYLK